MKKGAFAFVLHSHIPFVRKSGVWPFGEEWFYEGLAETYIPLLDTLNKLKEEGCKVKLTVSLTPVLLEQMSDTYMLSQFSEYVRDKINRAESDIKRFASESAFLKVAQFYREYYSSIEDHFENRYKRDVAGAFRNLQDAGYLEIMTSAATHGYLPLLERDSSIYGQIEQGIRTYRRHLGRNPEGFWLPECAYRPGYEIYENGKVKKKKAIDQFLRDAGISFFITDTHAVEGGETFQARRLGPYTVPNFVVDYTRPTYRTSFLPYLLSSGCTVFARNRQTGLQVWSGRWGYPGDGNYREFHKKDGRSGFQYWRVTATDLDLGKKEVYVRENIYPRIEENASHFVSMVEGMLADFNSKSQKFGIVMSPYDAELFGHWWFEGILFLEKVLRKMSSNSSVELTTLSDYLKNHPPQQAIVLPETSWGEGGYHYVWMNSSTEWMWPLIHEREVKMEKMVSGYQNVSGILRDVLNQMGRELLLLQSSDWPFLITTGQAKEYATRRFLKHCENFDRLCNLLELNAGMGDIKNVLTSIKDTDNLFPDLDYHIFKAQE